MKRLLLVALLFPLLAAGQEVVTIPTRPGVTQSFFIANMGGVNPQAVALVYSGGFGAIKLRLEGSKPKFQQGNFLVRTRTDFIRNGKSFVLIMGD